MGIIFYVPQNNMKTITQIKIQSSDKNKVNLFLDGDFYCSLSLEVAVKHNLKKDVIIDEKVLDNIVLESEKTLAYNQALKLVSTRYKTKREMEKYLQEKGYASPTIIYVLKRLMKYDFINDERYVESFVAHNIEKDGVIKIKQKLLQKGVKEDVIDGVINAIDDQSEQIKNCAKKYMKNKEASRENFAKLFRYLMNKGFRYEEVMSVLKQGEEW